MSENSADTAGMVREQSGPPSPAVPTEEPSLPAASDPADLAPGTAGEIVPAVAFSFVCYLTVGIPLAILPTFVHLKLGFGTILAGLVISLQYIATVASRPRAGRMSDVLGPKRTVVYGLLACASSGLATCAAAFFPGNPRFCLALLILGRLLLGTGESMAATGAIMWGIGRAGTHNTAQVIAWNGVAVYSALAVGAPIGILLEQRGGLATVGLVVAAVAALGVFFATRLARVPVQPSPHLPFLRILMRVAPLGIGLAIGGIGFGVLATFVTLFYAQQHWGGAALALTLYGFCFMLTRVVFYRLISRCGGFPVALVSFVVEAFGLVLLAFSGSRATAFLSAGLIGAGFSLVFPALAVEAVRHVPVANRGSALGAYNVFIDFSLFLTGPIAGAIIARHGYPAAFLWSAAGIVLALALTGVLYYRERSEAA